MITRAKISAASESIGGAGLIRGRRLLTFLSLQMRHLFEGGAYSSKYGISEHETQIYATSDLFT